MRLSVSCFLAGAAFLCAACNTVSTHNLQLQGAPVPDKKPSIFYVRDFESEGAEVTGDWQPAARDEFRAGVVRQSSRSLLDSLNKAGFTAQMQEKGGETADSGWVVTGRIRLLSNADSMTMQMDAQAVRKNCIETTVFVYDIEKSKVQPFMTFRVTGSRFSGETVAEPNPPASGACLDEECAKSAELIVHSLEGYIKDRALLTP